ncbi:MAG: HEWD family protein [Halodesulfurarchaeum sp.]
MSVEIRRPRTRRCLRCEREEVWDESIGTWRVEGEVGKIFCVHEWNITGGFNPVVEDSSEG